MCIFISCYAVPRAEEFRGSVTIEKFKKQRFEICNKRAMQELKNYFSQIIKKKKSNALNQAIRKLQGSNMPFETEERRTLWFMEMLYDMKE